MQTKICSVCWKTQPIDEFRRYRSTNNARRAECRTCCNAYARKRRARANERRIRAFVQSAKSERDVSRLMALCAEMIRHFGGLERFVSTWQTQLDIAQIEKPGSRLVLNSFNAIFQMVAAYSKCEERSRDEVSGLPHMPQAAV